MDQPPTKRYTAQTPNMTLVRKSSLQTGKETFHVKHEPSSESVNYAQGTGNKSIENKCKKGRLRLLLTLAGLDG